MNVDVGVGVSVALGRTVTVVCVGVGVCEIVAMAEGVAVLVGVAVAVLINARGTYSTCPLMIRSSDRQFADLSWFTVVPDAVAKANRVSPDRTRYVGQ